MVDSHRAAVCALALVLTAAGPVSSTAAATSAPFSAGSAQSTWQVSSATPESSGAAGYCHDDAGVTVVVDMTAFGGDVTVRCARGPVGPGFSGLDALKDTGFTVTGTQRYGLAFMCRIQGRPGADEPLAIPGNPEYREQCVDTPPQSAYWGYWYAPNGGSWTYSTTGAQTRDVIAGGFEGWAFSLDHASAPPKPAVDPVRPDAPPTSAPPTSSSTPPSTHAPPGGGSGPGGSTSAPASTGPTVTPSTSPAGGGDPGSRSAPTTSARPDPNTTGPTTRSSGSAAGGPHSGTGPNRRATQHAGRTHQAGVPTGSAPTAAATTSDVQVSGELPSTADLPAGSARPTIIGLAVLVLLGLGAGLAAWRRSHRA